MTGVLIKRGTLWNDFQGECHVRMKAGIGVMQLQAKDAKD